MSIAEFEEKVREVRWLRLVRANLDPGAFPVVESGSYVNGLDHEFDQLNGK